MAFRRSSGLYSRRFAAAVAATLVLLVSVGRGRADAQLRATPVAEGLDRPLGFVQHPTEATVQLILEQSGRVRVLRNGTLQATDFLDLRSQTAAGGERGLLGLAFAPDYAASGRVFVCFTNLSGHSVVARFLRSATDPLRLDPASRFDLEWPDGQRVITQPFSNHNGGHLAFGPDGLLYLGMGDGGSANDPDHHAQDPLSLLGKMLRLDVSVPASNSRGYAIPPTNPFVGRAGVLPEIWAFGLRNPWRWSFDDVRLGGTGAMVIGDVGQGAWEEVDYEPRAAGGRNYGWRNREGAHDNVTSLPPFAGSLIDPIFEYPRTTGRSVTGGHVYRGQALGASFVGRYFFGDFVTSRIWSIRLTVNPATREAAASDPVEHTAELGSGAVAPSSFGVDTSGEIYVVSYEGRVYRIDPPPGQTPAPSPSPTSPATGGRHQTGPGKGTARGRR
jgi:glucose/arabinose dehydrogenase